MLSYINDLADNGPFFPVKLLIFILFFFFFGCLSVSNVDNYNFVGGGSK